MGPDMQTQQPQGGARVLIDPKTGKPFINGSFPPGREQPEPMRPIAPTIGGVRG